MSLIFRHSATTFDTRKLVLFSVCLNKFLPNIKVLRGTEKTMILMDKIMCSFHIFPLNNELIEE